MSQRILGIIKRSERHKSGSGSNFTVAIPIKGKKKGEFEDITVICPFFCNARPNDSIRGLVEKKRERYTLIEPPFIEIPTDRASIIQAITNALRGTTQPIGEVRAESLYEYLKSKAKSVELSESEDNETLGMSSVSLYLSDLAKENNLEPLLNHLNKYQGQILLKNWYSQRDLRRLHCLGLTNMEINLARTSCVKLYAKLIVNPYSVPVIELSKAEAICKRLERPVTKKQIFCGTILRKVYANAQGKGWLHTPLRFIERDHPGASTFQDDLETDYDLIFNDAGIYLKQYYLDLLTILDFINITVKHEITPPTVTIVKKKTLKLTEEQRAAVTGALTYPICVITGGPGTGKTTCVRDLVEELQGRGRKPIMMAAVGKAASRLAKSTGFKATTIHRALNEMMTGRNPYFQEFDHIIIDEASTLNAELFAILIEQIKRFDRKITLTLIGDVNQLPPIGPGTPFESMIKSKVIPSFILTKNLRIFKGVNGIKENADKVVEAKLDHFVETPNFSIIEGDIGQVEDIVTLFKEEGIKLHEFQIISPFVKGKLNDTGPLQMLNEIVQRIYNSEAKGVTEPFKRKGAEPITFKIGDKVMANANNPDIDIFNGDDGVVEAIGKRGIIVDFGVNSLNPNERRLIDFPFYEPKEDRSDRIRISGVGDRLFDVVSNDDDTNTVTTLLLDLAGAISGYKSQGNEYKHVIIYLDPGRKHSDFLNNRHLNTMLTRAQKSVWLVGNIEVLEEAGRTPYPTRYDELASMLITLLGEIPEPSEEEEVSQPNHGYEIPPDLL